MDITSEICDEIFLGLTVFQSSCLYNNLASLKDLLTPADCDLLDKIIEVGQDYWQIKQFINEKVTSNFAEGAVGQYTLSFVEHLDKCLEPYRKEVYTLESEAPCLSHIRSRIYPYSELMHGLLLLVREVNICQKRGTAILETLDKHMRSSTRVLQVAIKYIHEGVSQLLLTQLQSWLLYGDIVDGQKEFFIQRNTDIVSTNPFEIYSLNYAQVPSFIRPLVVENILNIGQTVLYLRSRPGRHSVGEPLDLKRVIDSSGIIGEKAEAVVKEMKEAAKTDACDKWQLLERVVETVAAVVTAELHMLAMEEAGLVQQLHMVKDLFLMGRGELFHEFVTQTDLTGLKGYSAHIDLNLILHACAQKVLIREEMLEPFTLEASSSESRSEFRIHYTAPWPLELLFTSKVLQAYNHIFLFLLRLKRVQVKMVANWLRDKSKRQLVTCAKRRQLQQNLWFLVNNLQYYLQVDVLDSQFVSLEAAIVASQNFEQIRLAHSRFLSNLIVQSFLGSPQDTSDVVNPVQQRLNDILKLCEEFCTQVECSEDEEMPMRVVEGVTAKFDLCFQYLFALLAGLKKDAGHPCCQHLGQLLLRLDFNRFMSAHYSQGLID